MTLLLTCLFRSLPLAAQEKVLNVYNWTGYIDPAALEKFTAETGIKVQYDVYDNLETLEAKAVMGRSGYDVIFPTNEPSLSRLIRAGAVAPIDRARVPNLKTLDPVLMKRAEISDPGNVYGAIYLWGNVGMGVAADKVASAAPNAPMDSWDLLFKPANARRLAACGITMMDSPLKVIPSVLRYLGLRPDSTNQADLASVERTLMGIRPFIRMFAPDGMPRGLVDGTACLTVAYSGDVVLTAARATEAGTGKDVRFILPKEGAQVGFDMLAIPADSVHKDAAHAFIDFILRPDVIAGITNVTRYPNAVPASRPLINPALLADTNIFPTEEQMKGFFTPSTVPQSAKRARFRMWARFRDAN